MSDYLYTRAIRTEVTEEILKKFGVKDTYELETVLEQRKPSLYQFGKVNHFSMESCISSTYIDFILEYEYGALPGEYGNCYKLSIEDYQKYKKMFDELLDTSIDYSLCEVEYCYYNCSEPEDCYQEYDYSQKNIAYIELYRDDFKSDDVFNEYCNILGISTEAFSIKINNINIGNDVYHKKGVRK